MLNLHIFAFIFLFLRYQNDIKIICYNWNIYEIFEHKTQGDAWHGQTPGKLTKNEEVNDRQRRKGSCKQTFMKSAEI